MRAAKRVRGVTRFWTRTLPVPLKVALVEYAATNHWTLQVAHAKVLRAGFDKLGVTVRGDDGVGAATG